MVVVYLTMNFLTGIDPSAAWMGWEKCVLPVEKIERDMK